jgi:hypothetical protein
MTKLAKKSSGSKYPVVRLSREDHERLSWTSFEKNVFLKDLVALAIEHFYACPNGLAAYGDK